MKQIIDLTMPLKSDMAVYPGDPQVRLQARAVLEREGYRVKAVSMGTHSGTHVDLPAHFLQMGDTAETISLDSCFGRAFAAFAACRDGRIMVPDVMIPSCDILLLSTGHEKKLGNRDYFTPPPFSEELTDFLAARRFRAVGVDMPTVDHDGECHRKLLENSILIYEGLVNLERIIGREGVFYGFPLKLAEGDASPVRAVFCIETDKTVEKNKNIVERKMVKYEGRDF